MTPDEFVTEISSITLDNTFNPYCDRCEVHDKPRAPAVRRKLLRDILECAMQSEIDAIWIGRDLGYRGGRRTGMALTDDVHMGEHGARWGLDVARPTFGQPVAERTAGMVWDLLASIDLPVFLWNVFPLHPHEPNKPFTNRAHTARERELGENLLILLVELLRPKRLIAIGNDAAASARRIGNATTEVIHVRHPSYGGHKDFIAGIVGLYGIEVSSEQYDLFER